MNKTTHRRSFLLLLASSMVATTSGFVVVSPGNQATRGLVSQSTAFMTIVSPFDESAESSSDDAVVATKPETSIGEGPFELTFENVEMVLDEMRPYVGKKQILNVVRKPCRWRKLIEISFCFFAFFGWFLGI